MRARHDYGERRTVQADGFDPDAPVAGFYRMRLRASAPFVGVQIWHGAPLDPVTFEPLDRSHRWCAAINGRPVEIGEVWPRCARDPIAAADYAYLTTLQGWAARNAPESPLADPTRRVDPLTAPLPF